MTLLLLCLLLGVVAAGPILAGIVRALIGTYGGSNVRHSLVTKTKLPDFAVAAC
jgi:hypothetical protein